MQRRHTLVRLISHHTPACALTQHLFARHHTHRSACLVHTHVHTLLTSIADHMLMGIGSHLLTSTADRLLTSYRKIGLCLSLRS
jgi:hypothetical protein